MDLEQSVKTEEIEKRLFSSDVVLDKKKKLFIQHLSLPDFVYSYRKALQCPKDAILNKSGKQMKRGTKNAFYYL